MTNRFGSKVSTTIAIAGMVALAVVGPAANAGAQGSSNGASDRGHEIAASKQEFKAYHAQQPSLEIPILPTRPPANRTMIISTCEIQVCHATTDPAIAAAHLLGWSVTQVVLPLSGVQPMIDLWNKVIAERPDLMVYYGPLPISLVQSYVDQAAALGVKIVDIAPKGTVVSESGPVFAEVNGPGVIRLSGRLMADAVVADSHSGDAATAWVADPTRAFFKPGQAAFTDRVVAAGGTVDALDISLGQRSAIPGQVTAYVLAHPNVKYLAFALNDVTTGVAAALAAAGVADRVRIIGRAPSPAAIADIRSGAQWAAVTEEVESAGWRNIDQLARLTMGLPVAGDLQDPVGWHMIVDSSNVGDNPAGPAVPGFPQVFQNAWHLS